KSFVGIFDCGSISNREAKWQEKILPLMQEFTARKKSKWLIVISHPDHDHYNFLPSIIDYITPKLRNNDIKLTLVLGGLLDKYFYYQGGYSLIDKVSSLLSMNKPGVRVISMSHEINRPVLRKAITKTGVLKKQLKVPKEDIEATVNDLLGDPGYMKSAVDRRVDKELESITKKLSKLEIKKTNERVENGIKRELEMSLNDRSHLLQKSVKRYFRDSGLSHPLKNKLRGYVENTNLEKFIGLKFIPSEITISVLSANAGQSCMPSQPATIINDDENANSTVLQIVHNETECSILLPGDATGVTTDRVLSRLPTTLLGKVQYAIASHHGANTDETNNEEWVDCVRPAFVLFSASSQGNNFNHPRSSIVAQYLKYAQPGPAHDLTCFMKRNEREPDTAFKPFPIEKEFLDKDDDKVTIKGVTKQVYYSGDDNYFEGPYEFPCRETRI
ncbi:MAG: hypothetical protein NT128_04160, partial [Proteobacteria bacterium]|nr:hypothetical protein [Pseudomonadota bacterium]